MDRKKLLTFLLILLIAGLAGRAEALSLGEIGQSAYVNAYALGFLESTGPGTVSQSVAGTYYEHPDDTSSWGAYDTRAHASPGVLGTYIDFSYNNGGDWYGTLASAESADIFDVYDPAHANGTVGITFNAVIHGTLSSFGSDVGGNSSAYIMFGEYDPTTYSYWGGGPSSHMWNQLFYDSTSDGTTYPGTPTPSYTYYMTLDSTGRGRMASVTNLSSYASEAASSWSPSSGGVLADYYSTVSMSVTPQYGTTTITSQGGWDVRNAAPVPEPSTILLISCGLAGFAGMGLMKRMKRG